MVINPQNNRVLAIGEVKCWKDLEAAKRKAQRQIERFLNALESDLEISYTIKGVNIDSRLISHFDLNYLQTFSVSQEGGEAYGFDFTLAVDLEEVGELINSQNN